MPTVIRVRKPSSTGPALFDVPDRVVALGAAAVSLLVFVVVSHSVVDDGYISLSYIRNVAFHLHWGLVPSETANTATSPLNTILAAALTVILRNPLWGVGALFVITNTALAVAFVRLTRTTGLPSWSGVAGAVLVLFNPLLLSSIALESSLAAALLVLLVLAAAEERPVLFGMCTGFLALTRPELPIFSLILFLGHRRLWRDTAKVLASTAAVAIPWWLWSWLVLGSAVPETFLIKTTVGSWGAWTFTNGPLLYWQRYPTATALSFLPGIISLVALGIWLLSRVWPAARSRPASRLTPFGLLGLGGVLHYLAYSRVGVPPFHWYYAPSIAALTIFGAAALGAAFTSGPTPSLRGGGLRSAGTRAFAAAAVIVVGGSSIAYLFRELPWQEAAITTNWARPADYERIGKDLRRIVRDDTVQSPGEIGAFAYFCRCTIVDDLADPGRAWALIERRRARATSLGRWLIDLNYRHAHRQTPREADYVMWLVDGVEPAVASWPVSSKWKAPGKSLILTKP